MRAAEGPGRLLHGAASPAALRTRPERRRPRSRLSREPGPATPRPGRDGTGGGEGPAETEAGRAQAGNAFTPPPPPRHGGRSPPASRPPENKRGRDTSVAEPAGRSAASVVRPARGRSACGERGRQVRCGPVCSRPAPGEAQADGVLEIIWNTEGKKNKNNHLAIYLEAEI